MKAVYINLDAATARRASLEQSFAVAARPGWLLERLAAIDVNAPGYGGPRLRHTGPGRRLTRAEEGCFLSHRTAIERHAGGGEPFMVLEDDVAFCRESLELVEGMLAHGDDWDVIYTDAIIPHASGMTDLFRLRRRTPAGQVHAIDLAGQFYAGAAAYVVTPHGAAKLVELLRTVECESKPYDMALRDLVLRRELRACVLFPFPTTMAADAETSQIQDTGASSADHVWNTYRRLVWFGARPGDGQAALADLAAHYVDADTRDLAVVLAAVASTRFQSK
jgi:GR25 family glycosyltransferase involved in LPS biosynthesis